MEMVLQQSQSQSTMLALGQHLFQPTHSMQRLLKKCATLTHIQMVTKAVTAGKHGSLTVVHTLATQVMSVEVLDSRHSPSVVL